MTITVLFFLLEPKTSLCHTPSHSDDNIGGIEIERKDISTDTGKGEG
jgi:hypothetical protein